MDLLSSKDTSGHLSLGQSTQEEHGRVGVLRDSESMSTFPMTRTYSITLDHSDAEECCGETPRATGDHQWCQFRPECILPEDVKDVQKQEPKKKPGKFQMSPNKTSIKKTHTRAKDRLAKKLRIRTT
jgi:hypothetical protein